MKFIILIRKIKLDIVFHIEVSIDITKIRNSYGVTTKYLMILIGNK